MTIIKRQEEEIEHLKSINETSSTSSALIFEAEEYDELNMAESGDLILEVVADSGASDHIISPANIPGIEVTASRASRNGGGYITASGDRIPNEGQCALQLETADGENAANSVFQVAQVTRNLMSIGRICDNGNEVLFTKDKGVVTGKNGKVIVTFERDKGLYVATLTAKKRNFTDLNGERASKPGAQIGEPGFTGQGVTK